MNVAVFGEQKGYKTVAERAHIISYYTFCESVCVCDGKSAVVQAVTCYAYSDAAAIVTGSDVVFLLFFFFVIIILIGCKTRCTLWVAIIIIIIIRLSSCGHSSLIMKSYTTKVWNTYS